jgi:hypothetical protein
LLKNQVHYFDCSRAYTGVLVHFNKPFLVQQSTEANFLLKGHLFHEPGQLPFCQVDPATAPLLADYLRLMKAETGTAQVLW